MGKGEEEEFEPLRALRDAKGRREEEGLNHKGAKGTKLRSEAFWGNPGENAFSPGHTKMVQLANPTGDGREISFISLGSTHQLSVARETCSLNASSESTRKVCLKSIFSDSWDSMELILLISSESIVPNLSLMASRSIS